MTTKERRRSKGGGSLRHRAQGGHVVFAHRSLEHRYCVHGETGVRIRVLDFRKPASWLAEYFMTSMVARNS